MFWKSGVRFRHFVTAFGVAWLFIEPSAVFFPNKVPKGWLLLGSVVVVCAIVAALRSRSPKRAVLKLRGLDAVIEVRPGDLLEEASHLIIGTNDCFDTEIGAVVNARSVQGQFLARKYSGDQAKLDVALDGALKQYDGEKKEDASKTRGKKWRYPLGTVAVLDAGHAKYFLAAYTRMGTDLVCESDVDLVWQTLWRTWHCVRTQGEGMPVAMPIIGSEFARTGLSRLSLIKIIVLSFILATRHNRTVTRKLSILVHQSDLQKVDFAEIAEFFRHADM